jgi:hypothetical protein
VLCQDAPLGALLYIDYLVGYQLVGLPVTCYGCRSSRSAVQLLPPPLRSPVASLGLDKSDLEHLRALPDESDEPLPFFG